MTTVSESSVNKTAPRLLQGVVKSDKMHKGIVVAVEYLKADPRVGKFVRKMKKVHAHDENNVSKVGDFVEVQECRPYSKTKTWRLVKVINSGN
jgi:small subunit ribosomal protein S17